MKPEEFTKILETFLLKDQRLLKLIKNYAVDNHNYELAAQTRSFEKENFNIKKDEEIMQRARDIQKGLEMCDLNVNLKTAYHLDLAMKEIYNKGNMLDLKLASEIKAKVESQF